MRATRYAPSRRLRRALAGVALLACAGCSFFKPRGDSTLFFVLTATPTPPPRATTGAPPRLVALGAVQLPEYLDRPQLVTRLLPNELRISENERWAEPLADALGRTLKQDLAGELAGDTVVQPPWDATQHPDVELAVEVLRFERVSDSAVELSVRWKLRDGGGQLRLTRESEVRQATVGADAQAAVAALSQSLATLAHELAQAIGARPATPPTPPTQ